MEEKIRYLCRKFPSLEWSGILFTRHTGTFEDGSLEIHCEDIYPMDLGSPGFTQFKMDETVAGYIADNIELFDCDLQLVHSHNQMQAFFSGTDTQTLREEGNDRNCFVSLIVNNAGVYSAAITRKIQRKTEVVTKSLGTSYEFFGEGEIKTDEDPVSESTQIIDKEVIEYFMLDIEVEHVENPLEYLDTRFNEIVEKKQQNSKPAIENPVKTPPVQMMDKEFFDWIHSERNKSAEAKEAMYTTVETGEDDTLFSEEEMMYAWEPDPTIIYHLTAQLITCSLIINPDIDLKQWITRHMTRKYKEMFRGDEFEWWAETYTDFIINHYHGNDAPAGMYHYDKTSKIAEAIILQLEEYPSNEYIERYKTQLTALYE